MPFGDILSLIAGGATRGYRQSEDLQRQVIEARRKALMEERQQALDEEIQRKKLALETSDSQSLQTLRGLQGQETQADIGNKNFATSEAKRRSLIGQQPVPADILGGDVKSPLTYEQAGYGGGNIVDLLREHAQNRFRELHPESYGGRERKPQTREEAMTKILEVVGRLQPTQFESLPGREDIFAKRQQQTLDLLKKEMGLSVDIPPTNSETKLTPQQKYQLYLKKKRGK